MVSYLNAYTGAPSSPVASISVCLGYCNKITQTGQLKTNVYFSQFWNLEVQIRVPTWLSLINVDFLAFR